MKEHLNDGITLKELKEKYGISNDHIKYMIALYKRHGEEAFHDKIQKYSRELKLEAIKRVYNGEPLGKWTITLILAIAFVVMGVINAIVYVKPNKTQK